MIRRLRARSRRAAAATLAACSLLGASRARADEGQWLPGQIAELDRAQLENRGLELEPSELWSESGGLMRAAVQVSGCSGAFVSDRGLIATNHHCAHRAIQTQSSPEKDYLKLGFVARKPEAELEAKGYTVQVLESIEDVTEAILRDAQHISGELERALAIERAQKTLTLDCEKKHPDLRCEVVGFFMGSRFQLQKRRELRDVRIVYAPPGGIGDYGGEIDNWMWPRHTGDFALLRAYVAPDGKPAEYSPKNVPYRPAQRLEISADGVRPSDWVAVLGYPGNTRRYLPSRAVERFVRDTLPASVSLLSEWLALLDSVAARSPALTIQLASQRRSWANRVKNAQGTLAGLRRTQLLDRKRREEQQLTQSAREKNNEAGLAALTALDKIAKARAEAAGRELVLDQLSSGPPLLSLAIDLVRRARERQKPDLERESAYMDRNSVQQWKLAERRLRDYVPELEAQLIASLLVRSQQLPEAQRIPALAPAATGAQHAALAAQWLARLRGTRLAGAEHVKTLFDGAAPEQLAQSGDPLLTLASALAPELERLEQSRKAQRGLQARVAPAYFELLKSARSGPIYPDANGTLRFSYARVMGYEPQDGLLARPQTTLAGALSKHTGAAPFDLPRPVRDKAGAAKASRWADPHLDDLPLCFLTNADTSGGNSGSPVINGRGELVGLNFDRVWENVAGDFGYHPDRSRNIVVDVRYMLWLLESVDRAPGLLRELGVAEASGSGRAATGKARKLAEGDDEAHESTRCGCRVPGQPGPVPPSWAVLLCLAAACLTRSKRKRR